MVGFFFCSRVVFSFAARATKVSHPWRALYFLKHTCPNFAFIWKMSCLLTFRKCRSAAPDNAPCWGLIFIVTCCRNSVVELENRSILEVCSSNTLFDVSKIIRNVKSFFLLFVAWTCFRMLYKFPFFLNVKRCLLHAVMRKIISVEKLQIL